MNFDIKDLKSWANRHDVKIKSVTGFFGNSLLEIDNEIRKYNKGEKGHLHELYQISNNGCFCFGYATYFADTGAFSGTSNFAFFLPLDAVKKDIKMNFNIKDVKSWSNRYDVKIGDEGYFFHDIDKLRNFENEYIKPVKSKLSAIRDNYARCFQIDNGRDGDNVFDFFLPLDAVKEEKKYRACRTVQELYELVFNCKSNVEDRFCIDELVGTVIHFKQKGSGTTYYECITGIVVYNNSDIDIRIDGDNFELPELFKSYEIEINGEWQPFGAVENGTGE